MGILDRIQVPELPILVQPFFLFVRTSGTLGGLLETILIDPLGKETGKVTVEAGTERKDPSEPGIVQFLARPTIRLEREGTHWFEVRFRGRHLGASPFVVVAESKAQDDSSHPGSLQKRRAQAAAKR